MIQTLDNTVKNDYNNDNRYYLEVVMRYSRQRELILNLVKSSCEHPTAEDVYEQAKRIEPSLSLGTVYRNLKNLADGGVVTTLETMDKRVHYDGNLQSHRHFICKKCGKIVDLFVSAEIPKELSDMGLTVEDEKCIYYGICGDCMK